MTSVEPWKRLRGERAAATRTPIAGATNTIFLSRECETSQSLSPARRTGASFLKRFLYRAARGEVEIPVAGAALPLMTPSAGSWKGPSGNSLSFFRFVNRYKW